MYADTNRSDLIGIDTNRQVAWSSSVWCGFLCGKFFLNFCENCCRISGTN